MSAVDHLLKVNGDYSMVWTEIGCLRAHKEQRNVGVRQIMSASSTAGSDMSVGERETVQ